MKTTDASLEFVSCHELTKLKTKTNFWQGLFAASLLVNAALAMQVMTEQQQNARQSKHIDKLRLDLMAAEVHNSFSVQVQPCICIRSITPAGVYTNGRSNQI